MPGTLYITGDPTADGLLNSDGSAPELGLPPAVRHRSAQQSDGEGGLPPALRQVALNDLLVAATSALLDL